MGTRLGPDLEPLEEGVDPSLAREIGAQPVARGAGHAVMAVIVGALSGWFALFMFAQASLVGWLVLLAVVVTPIARGWPAASLVLAWVACAVTFLGAFGSLLSPWAFG